MEIASDTRIDMVAEIVNDHPEVAGFQSYEYFRNNSADQKEEFIAGSQAELNLAYPAFDQDRLKVIEEPARRALQMLMLRNPSLKSEVLYRAIEYRYTELFMVSMAIRMQDQTLSDSERLEAQQWFVQTNEALYGQLDQATFGAIFECHVRPLLESDSVQPSRQIIQSELKDMIGEIPESNQQLFVPAQTTKDRLSQLTRERFDDLVEHIERDEEYDVDEMVIAIQLALDKSGGTELGWQVAKVSDSSALAVSAHQRLVEVGENRRLIKGEKLKTRVVHEVGVHALRSINAEQAGYISAAYGQDGYLNFEEALATILEDAYTGNYSDHGIDYYLGLAWAYGLDNHPPRNLREVYEMLWRKKVLSTTANKEADITDELVQKAKSQAYQTVIRLFRGTDTKQRGVVYLKDLAYFNGQALVWPELDKVHTQADLDKLLAGKLDLTQEDHNLVAELILAELKH